MRYSKCIVKSIDHKILYEKSHQVYFHVVSLALKSYNLTHFLCRQNCKR